MVASVPTTNRRRPRTMTTPLSPAAAAVLTAYMNNCGWLDGPLEKDYRCAAAVLRVAADQVVPDKYSEAGDDYGEGFLVAHLQHRGEFLAIAAELEAYDDDVSDRLLAIATELEAL